jgi:hypothetical protein
LLLFIDHIINIDVPQRMCTVVKLYTKCCFQLIRRRYFSDELPAPNAWSVTPPHNYNPSIEATIEDDKFHKKLRFVFICIVDFIIKCLSSFSVTSRCTNNHMHTCKYEIYLCDHKFETVCIIFIHMSINNAAWYLYKFWKVPNYQLVLLCAQ